jgi:hypothetical protein
VERHVTDNHSQLRQQNSRVKLYNHPQLNTSPKFTQSNSGSRIAVQTKVLQAEHINSCNSSKARKQALPNPANNIDALSGVSQTLRQACYRENPGSAMCVQNLDDSRGLAIRITYRISLRSSSLWEPRHPLLKVVRSWIGVVMILPQVHLRKPCYDFTFL